MRQETVLFLVRHGEAEQNVRRILDSFPGNPEFGLTETGREQVRKSAEAIAHEGVDFLFSSPIRRARETAEAIAEACGGVSINFDDRLRETDFGVWSGRSADDFWAKYPDPKMRADGNGEEGLEGFLAMRGRLAGFLNDILSGNEGRRMALVSHGDPLEQLHGLLVGDDIEATFSGWYPDKGAMTRIGIPIGFRVHVS